MRDASPCSCRTSSPRTARPAEELTATAVVNVEQGTEGFEIKESAITLDARVPGIEEDKFRELAEKAKAGCPVSKALGAIKVTLTANLQR